MAVESLGSKLKNMRLLFENGSDIQRGEMKKKMVFFSKEVHRVRWSQIMTGGS